MSFTFAEAFFLGLVYFFSWTETLWGPFHMYDIWQSPLTEGFIIGLFYGDPTTALMVSGSVFLLYIGSISVGANLPSDRSLATVISVPFALKLGLSAQEAIVIAVPFGILGAFLNNARRVFGRVWTNMAAKHIDAGQYSKLTWDCVILPEIATFIYRALPVTFLLYLFGEAAGTAVANLPANVSTAFQVVGEMLPAVGLMMCVNYIGGIQLLPFFAIGFFCFKTLGMPSLLCFIIGLSLAVIYVTLFYKDEDDDDDTEIEDHSTNKMFTKKDISNLNWRWLMWSRMSQSMDTFYGLGCMYAMYPFLAKVYKDDEKTLKESLHRHMDAFITNHFWGSWLLPASLAIEEDIAINGDETGEKAQAIRSMKSSLMGPFAGIGDTIDPFTIGAIYKGVMCSWAIESGTPLCLIGGVLMGIYQTIVSEIWCQFGYRAGKDTIINLIYSTKFKKILNAASIIGVFMMGALCAQNVTPKIAYTYQSAEGVVVSVAAKMDSLLPGLIPLLTCGLTYLGIKKGKKATTIMIYIVVIGFVCGILGILS